MSWHWLDRDHSYGFELRDPIPGFPTEDEAVEWSARGVASHPVLRWYAHTGDLTPMSVGRVPPAVAPGGHAILHDLLAPYGLEQQLSIPYRVGAGQQHTFVMSRPRDDFTDQELAIARFTQPLLAMLDRQAATLARAGRDPGAFDLTCRELAVLQLLREGLTASAMAHRLLISPRTVHSHLRRVYRKLGVDGRMQAVLVSQELGLLPVRGTPPGANGVHLGARWVSPSPAATESPLTVAPAGVGNAPG